MPITANIRNAASWPFHTFDCHIKNHSPPTLRKATIHISRLSVSAIIAILFAWLNAAAAPLSCFASRNPPHQHRSMVTISHAMIDT